MGAGLWPVSAGAAQALQAPGCHKVCLSGKAAGGDGPCGRLQADALAPCPGGKCTLTLRSACSVARGEVQWELLHFPHCHRPVA